MTTEELKNKLASYTHFIWDVDEIINFHNTLLLNNRLYVIFLIQRMRYIPGETRDGSEDEIVDFQPFLNNSLESFLKALYCLLAEASDTLEGTVVYIGLNPLKEGSLKFLQKSFFKGTIDAPDLRALNPGDIEKYCNSNRSEIYRIVDVDTREKESITGEILDFSQKNKFYLHETRGGFHVITTEKDADLGTLPVHRESVGRTPIPGTIQGGFKVKSLL